jgi:hypothetical protein
MIVDWILPYYLWILKSIYMGITVSMDIQTIAYCYPICSLT